MSFSGTSGWRVAIHPVVLVSLLAAFALQAYVFLHLGGAPPIRSDGWGYYLHLPATLVWGDPWLSFLKRPDLPPDIAQYHFADGTWQGLFDTGTGYRDKYALGPAVMQLPFFLVAWAVTALTRPEVNGFETPFQAANVISGAFYFAFGVWLVYRAARLRYGRAASLAAVAFAVLGTNVLFYGSVDASFSHVYGFFLIAGVMALLVRRVERGGAPALGEFALFGLLMGLAVMVRPTNAVAGLLYLPFVHRAPLGRIAVGTLIGLAAATIGALPQMLMWLATTGELIYYSYRGEGFTLLDPSFWAYLTSIRKGIFFWHPAYLVMIAALAAQLRVRVFETSVLLAVVGLNIWFGASWSDITFGDSFGCRQIVEIIPLLVPATAAAIAWLASGPVRRYAAGGLAALMIAVNGVQLYGYLVLTIPHNKTTMEQYLAFWSDTLGIE
jgi:hypothetical protein